MSVVRTDRCCMALLHADTMPTSAGLMSLSQILTPPVPKPRVRARVTAVRRHMHGASNEHALKLGHTCSHASLANPVSCSMPCARPVSASPWRAAVQHQYMRECDSNMHGQLCPTQIHAPSCTTQRSIAATALGQPAQLVIGALAPLLHSSAAWALIGLRSVLYSNAEAVPRARGRDRSAVTWA